MAEHYTEGRRWSHISNAWILLESWNDREEIASLRASVADLEKGQVASQPSDDELRRMVVMVPMYCDDMEHAYHIRLARAVLSAYGVPEGVAAQPTEPRNIRDRWNVEMDGDDLLVCFNGHEKGEKCEYVRYVRAAGVPTSQAPSIAVENGRVWLRCAVPQGVRNYAFDCTGFSTPDNVRWYAKKISEATGIPLADGVKEGGNG